jgi:hypothetical protein
MARGYGKGSNSSGRGPVGKAPASRAPIKAAVTPKGLGTLNPNAKGGPVRTGGGEGSNKHVRVTPVGGSPSTRKVAPGAAGDFGKAIGTHSMGNGGREITRRDPPLHVPTQAATEMGNTKALEGSGSGARPGGGNRTIHPSGGQRFYGADANHPGNVDGKGSITPAGSGNAGTSIRGTGQRGSSFQQGGRARGPSGFGFTGGGPGKA